MPLDSEDMTVFLAVVREGSFGRAASSLMMAQPSVSERIARLERDLGAPLFTRAARGAAPTAAGEQLISYARRLLDLFEEAARTVRHTDRPAPLRIGVHATFAHRAVPLVLAALAGQPRRITVTDAHSDEVIARLLDGVIDIGFVLPGARPRPLRFIALSPDPVVAVCAPSHRLAGQRADLKAIAAHRLAINRWGRGADQFLAQLHTAGMPEQQLTECSDGHTALALARHHDHVALVTRTIADHDLEQGSLAPVHPRPALRWNVPLALAYRAVDRDEPAIRLLHAELARPGSHKGERSPSLQGGHPPARY
jgi:DNA-binding transcriptional LysR family regulator